MTSRFRTVWPCLLFGASALLLRGAAAPTADTVIESLAFDSQSTDTQTVSVFTTNVTVTGNDIRITCDRLEVISLRSGGKEDIIGKQDRFKSLTATGRVRIVQGDREATCERAEVLPGEDRITLSGNPMVVDHGNNSTATGEPLILYRGDRRIHGTNVRIILPPLKDLGFDKSQPPPAPTVGGPKSP
jgi:lipopolysaccharide export system protein LptA